MSDTQQKIEACHRILERTVQERDAAKKKYDKAEHQVNQALTTLGRAYELAYKHVFTIYYMDCGIQIAGVFITYDDAEKCIEENQGNCTRTLSIGTLHTSQVTNDMWSHIGTIDCPF